LKFSREQPINTCLNKTKNGFKWKSNRSLRKEELIPVEKVTEVAGNDAVHMNPNGEDNDFKRYIDSACESLKDDKRKEHENKRVKLEKKRDTAEIYTEHLLEKYNVAKDDLIEDKANYLENKKLFSEKQGLYIIRREIYLFFMICLIIPEWQLSKLVFAFLADNEVLAQNIISFTIAGAVPFVGHFYGIMFRQGSKHKYLWFFGASVVLLLISFASLIRADYAEQAQDQVQQIHINPWVSVPLFFSLNMTVLLVAILISYYRHDDNLLKAERNLRESKKSFRHSTRQTRILEKKYLKAKLQVVKSTADINSSDKIIDFDTNDIEEEGKKRKRVYDLTYANVRNGIKQSQET